MASRRKPVVPDELLDQLLGGSDALEAFQSGDLVQDLKKALAERILNAELDHHLDDEAEQSIGNHRNGHSRKRVLTDNGRMELSIPRDRQGRFDPKLVEKHCRRLPGFDDKVISMYARGMSTREIQGHVRELYGIEVSPELISKVTDAVLDELAGWQSRPLESVYAIVYFDAVRVKIRDEGLVKNKAVYLAIGYTCDGYKQILGLWIEQTEGAKFWLSVMNDLKARGLEDILIAVVDGLGGFPQAIETAYTTNAVESLNSTVRRAVRSKGHFPHDEAAKKLIYLALRGVAAKWKRPPQFWWQVKGEFAIRFEERFKMVQG